jgi:hypothetical protein
VRNTLSKGSGLSSESERLSVMNCERQQVFVRGQARLVPLFSDCGPVAVGRASRSNGWNTCGGVTGGLVFSKRQTGAAG